MPQSLRLLNDTCTKGPRHKLLLAHEKDIRNRWIQRGEKNEERTFIILHRHGDSLQGQFWGLILQKQKERKRHYCTYYLPCIFTPSTCPSAVSVLAWKQGLHSLGTKPESMPTGPDPWGDLCGSRTRSHPELTPHSAWQAAEEHTQPFFILTTP